MIKELAKLLKDDKQTIVLTISRENQHCRLCLLPGGPTPSLTAVDTPENLDAQFVAAINSYLSEVVPLSQAVANAKAQAKNNGKPNPPPAPSKAPIKQLHQPLKPKPAPTKPKPAEEIDLNDPKIFEGAQVTLDRDENRQPEPPDNRPAIEAPDLAPVEPVEPTEEEIDALLGFQDTKGEGEVLAMEQANAEGDSAEEALFGTP